LTKRYWSSPFFRLRYSRKLCNWFNCSVFNTVA